jgi:hypothetical protein
MVRAGYEAYEVNNMQWRNIALMTGLSLAVGISAGGASARAQQTAAGVPVHMVVSVESRHGAEIPALKREDVVVTQGRDRNKVMEWVPATSERAGLDLYVLLDDSSRWTVDTQLAEVRSFILQQPASTFIAVGYIHNGFVQMTQHLTTEHAGAAKAVGMPIGNSSGEASPYFALEDLLKHWQPDPARPRREVVMITSGVDLYSPGSVDPYLDEAIEQMQRAGILVYSIYTPDSGHAGYSFLRQNWGQNNLAQISGETGAESYDLGIVPAESFKPYFDDISRQLGHQYLLTFLAKREKKAGMQTVRLNTESPAAGLVGAGRVYVPASSTP